MAVPLPGVDGGANNCFWLNSCIVITSVKDIGVVAREDSINFLCEEAFRVRLTSVKLGLNKGCGIGVAFFKRRKGNILNDLIPVRIKLGALVARTSSNSRRVVLGLDKSHGRGGQ